MEIYNQEQKEAIRFEGKHLLLLAGAGTGKTKTIVGRAAHLIENGTPAEKIQILTFTKRAASEIVERVKAGIPGRNAQALNGSTFHSWCNQLISSFPNLFGAANYTVIDSDDQLSLMKMACGKDKTIYGQIRIKPQEILDLFSFARNTRTNLTETIRKQMFRGKDDVETNEEIEELRPVLELLIKEYQALKMEQKYLDYDDLLLVVGNRLHKDEEARAILSKAYDYILVDEMQDTNPLQWYLLAPFENICKLFCVGDDAQSIYSFRGADFKNVHSFGERVQDSEVKKLNKNYRSTQEILDVSNWLLERSPIIYDKKLTAHRGPGKMPVVVNVSNQFEEANYIAEKILTDFREGGKMFSDFLVLSRSQYYTKPLQAVFLQKKIPYETYGGRKFLEAAHIKDLISILRVVNNPSDQIAWMRYLTFAHGIGEVRASNYLKEIMGVDSVKLDGDFLKSIIPGKEGEKIKTYYNAVQNNKGNVRQAIKELYKEMELDLAFKYAKDWEEKRKGDFPVLELLAEHYSTLGEFITEGILDNSISLGGSPVLEGSKIKTTEHKDHVVISTVHSAKGLEADVCFVLNVSPKTYPSSYSLGSTDEIEEERRVLYVALTRAKNELIITRTTDSLNAHHSNAMNPFSQEEINSAYFLEGLPENLVVQEQPHTTFSKAQDAKKENKIDLDFGFDFS
ncbi:ATP-dependent helicase [Aequorivita sp. SDUM287046]|uniref:DNA 3'-5' helicase n=1 Tax=Aequorivita aurantiaca TaxID=3053356 RepID=A0ABT8DJV6_9FLAO|nr:ATP-dependent helicase [Aequorivita aurantiaca]MDN3725109.1 ATP-dependent helicase [Aequorivita aurantiaca]